MFYSHNIFEIDLDIKIFLFGSLTKVIVLYKLFPKWFSCRQALAFKVSEIEQASLLVHFIDII
jgi:hypothetical protein